MIHCRDAPWRVSTLLITNNRMKTLAFIAAFAALVCFGATNATADNHNKQQASISSITDDPTPAITQFVKTYFPKANVQMVHADWDEFEVKLSDGTELEFNRSFEWTKIDCEHSSLYPSVPAELVPEQIASYVKSTFAKQDIVKIEKKGRGWEIELTNDIEIKFNKNFKVTKIGD